MRFYLISASLMLLWNCSGQGVEQTEAQPDPDISIDTTTAELPFIGFNCKASYQTTEQVVYADSLFSTMTPEALANMVLRIPGGTRSQKDFAVDWPDHRMQLWTQLQGKYGYKMAYVVNGNDTPANQLALIRRWQKNRAEFVFLEMMTEYYLPKFAKPKLHKEEVTRRVTPELYTERILPAFYQKLDSLNLPYFLIFAPAKLAAGVEVYGEWNAKMMTYVHREYRNREIGAVLHLYRKDLDEPYDYDQVTRLRERMPKGMPIAVTEFGVLVDDISPEEHAVLSVEHAAGITAELRRGDFLLDQVLFHDYPRNLRADANPRMGGITPKGRMMVEYFNTLYP